MSFFDDFCDAAKNVADKTEKKAGEIYEKGRLKLSAVKLETEIKRAYERLGAIVYEQGKKAKENPKLISLCMKEIDLLKAKLEFINEKLGKLNQYVKCENCCYYNSRENMFCSKCGSSLKSYETSYHSDFNHDVAENGADAE